MEDFIAHNSRWRLFFIILGAVVFVALGMWMVGMFGEVPSSSRYPAGFVMFMGWICIGFFGLCALAGVKKFFDGEAQLHIGPSGIRWSSWSNQLIPWLEIRDITTWSYRGQKSIILHLKNPRDFPASGLARMFAGINQRLAGGDISIPLTGTNCNYDEAMSAIEHFRSVAADADPQTGMTLQAQQQDGSAVTLYVVAVGAQSVKADGHHPLAGEDISFDVTLREIKDAA